MNIAIIDCGMGNLRSLFKAFYFPASSLHPTVNAKFVRSVQEIRQVDTGQGCFLHCIKSLNNNGLQKVLQEVFLKRTFLGICVDAQLFFEKNDQENCTDLELYHGIVKALAKQIDDKKIKIPYIGWNTLKQKKAHLLYKALHKIVISISLIAIIWRQKKRLLLVKVFMLFLLPHSLIVIM